MKSASALIVCGLVVFSGDTRIQLAEASVTTPPVLPAPPPGGEASFVVEHFGYTYEKGKDDCPDGLANMLRANFLATLPLADRAKLELPENAAEMRKRYEEFATRPDGTDICSHMERFNHPAQRTVQGKISKGFDLDGDATGASGVQGCEHTNFTSPSGEAGIDNQLWRAMGCLEHVRGKGDMPPTNAQHFGMSLANGENAQVLTVRGIDSWVNDDNVQIFYANTQDRAIVGPDRKFLAGASYTVGTTPNGGNVLSGRIENGIIEAKGPELKLRQIYYLGKGLRGDDLKGTRSIWDFRNVRLRLVLQADGSLKGMLGGYQPVNNVMLAVKLGGAGAALTADMDCPSQFAAVLRMADGHRDKQSGQCTTISSALEITAIPAFVSRSAELRQRK